MRTGSPRIHGLFWSTLFGSPGPWNPMKGKGERSVGEDGVKRPLNERKENVWKGRKADCEPASLFVGDTLSTDGQWLHWIVLKNREKRKKKKRKIRLCSRIGRCVEEKKENKNGREKRKDDGGAWWREDREGKVIIIWIAGIVSIHRRLARPIDRRLQLINLFKLDDALIDDHSANTFYNSTVSLGSVFSRSRIERSTLPYFAGSRFYWFSIGRDCFGVRRDIALSCYFTFIFTWYIHLQDLGTRGTQVPTEVTL